MPPTAFRVDMAVGTGRGIRDANWPMLPARDVSQVRSMLGVRRCGGEAPVLRASGRDGTFGADASRQVKCNVGFCNAGGKTGGKQ